ncbi:hypothetical protein CHH28_17395 [Bacterioplanes sanyensis]|uniref:Uncharacterized protein n=1 Tax=Bacterioplanes sanyensis TaxID=1249553 RepID=A0A222FNQ8_9GAMM|nr:hypothetical protein [Bacterioplanes sanyensis]ASP40342.1 hypothetical protein CHH28_17395 [Bacterioplanes sanyensis]
MGILISQATEENLRKLVHEIRKTPSDVEATFPKGEHRNLRKILLHMHEKTESWNRNCTISAKSEGSYLNKGISSAINGEKDALHFLKLSVYTSLIEYNIKEITPDDELIETQKQIETEVEKSTSEELRITIRNFPAKVLTNIVRSNDYRSFLNFSDLKAEADEAIDQSNKFLKETKEQLKNIESRTRVTHEKTNFIKLTEGFKSLHESKKEDLAKTKAFLIALGVLVLIPPTLGFLHTSFDIKSILDLNTEIFSRSLPLISIEIILIYFFRIVLSNHQSLKAEILQLSLRTTLCEFIQDYAKNSKDMKENDQSALEKFEAVIFSGIASNPEKIPNTFDGLDQILRIAKSIKSGG